MKISRPRSVPSEGQIAPFDAGWNSHELGLERRTVELLTEGSDGRNWALLGYDARSQLEKCIYARAEKAYVRTFEGDWGIKASSEDAMLSVITEFWRDFPEHAAGIIAIRNSEDLSGLCDEMSDEHEQEGEEADAIVRFLVPELERILGEIEA